MVRGWLVGMVRVLEVGIQWLRRGLVAKVMVGLLLVFRGVICLECGCCFGRCFLIFGALFLFLV